MNHQEIIENLKLENKRLRYLSNQLKNQNETLEKIVELQYKNTKEKQKSKALP
jgi:hypothetical protein